MNGYSVRRRNLSTYLGVGLIGLTACGTDGGSSDAIRTDSAGIEIVTSTGVDRPLEWGFHRELALGGADDGPESFYRVAERSVRADAHGNLYIMDGANHQVSVFDANGRHIRSLGGEGGGPGEFLRIATFDVSPTGAVAVFDFGKGSLVRFHENGEVDDEEPFTLFPAPFGERHFARFGDTTMAHTVVFEPEQDFTRQVLKRIVGLDTTLLIDLPTPNGTMAMYPECGGGLNLPPLFSPTIGWATASGIVVYATTTDYSISVEQRGRLSRIVRRDTPPIPASRETAVEYLGEGFNMNFGRGPCLIDPGKMVEDRGFEATVPMIQSLLVSPSGEIWVQRFANPRGTVGAIDVFDADGVYVGTIDTESFQPIILLPGDRVGVVEKDESDIERLVIMSIQRGEG